MKFLVKKGIFRKENKKTNPGTIIEIKEKDIDKFLLEFGDSVEMIREPIKEVREDVSL